MPKRKTDVTVYTIGHSTHTLDEFKAILDSYEIKVLVDVRTIPKSRHNPQFNKDSLQSSFRTKYKHMQGLGGLRHSRKDSPNTGWKNASFRGYADYMLTDEFVENLEALIDLAKKKKIAIMCAEAVPWRCHRSLIGDALLVRRIEVIDIFSVTNSKPHKLTKFAKVTRRRITYPP
jgi:uncharacterized protein (DUF488 family)